MTAEDLDKVSVGSFLGDIENTEVLEKYIELIDFSSLEIDDALRFLLTLFRLPGEAQLIDRIVKAFAHSYFKHNEETTCLSSASTAYILSFSIIMLNTDAHNPQVKNKMTKQEFVRNNRGIDGGKDLDPKYLAAVYKRIVNNEIVMEDERFTRQ